MKILQVCKKFPYPPKDGEAIAILGLTRALRELGHEMTLLCMNTGKHYFDLKELPAEVDALASFQAVDVDSSVKPLAAAANLLSRETYHVTRFRSQAFSDRLRAVLQHEDFDVVQLEGVYLSIYVPLIREHSNAAVVLRAHNVEHEIWERLTDGLDSGLKKIYLRLQARRLKRFEERHLADFDGVVTISERDRQRLRGMGLRSPSFTLPAGIDPGVMHFDEDADNRQSVFFIGGMDWLPNQEGVRWFLRKVWKRVLEEFPESGFHLAGRNMPEEWTDMSEEVQADLNMTVHGEVKDAHAFMREHRIMVVPLLSGSGMRIKILEALALGRWVISTTVGAEGIDYEDGVHLLIADDADTFVDRMQQIMRDPEWARSLGSHGRELVFGKYDSARLASGLIEFYEKEVLNA